MRMYLSSYLWGNHPEKILELLGQNVKRALIITNAADQYSEDGIVERFRQDQEFLTNYGIKSTRLDLRNYFKKDSNELKKLMKNYGLVWVRGANVFVLRRAMKQSGFDEIIVEMLNEDTIVYGGYSAAACVMGSTLHGLELVDDANFIPEKYESTTIWDGLNIFPYAIAPHYKSNHPETELIDEAITYFKTHDIPYKALRDGEAIVLNGNKIVTLG